MDMSTRWRARLDEGRRKADSRASVKRDETPTRTSTQGETRTEIERDHDRILFSTPVRRLSDKTQVFPLEKHDSVRTRLTHSHEVSNLARSIGVALVFEHGIAKDVENSERNIPALLAAVGLAHDLGNPPFGHQGENAIQSWFSDNEKTVLTDELTKQQKQDFLSFEGNAQGFRLVTRLQLLNDDFGLDLTYASLAALMKYPTSSDKRDKASVVTKKHNFFASEQAIAEDVLRRTGLTLGRRHALTYVMEACDDIAYVVMDVEDAIKKGLASYSDVVSYLGHAGKGDALTQAVIDESDKKHDEYRQSPARLSPAELNDISMQRFRVAAIGQMIRAAVKTFVERQEEFLDGTANHGLMALSSGEVLRRELKEFGVRHAYTHRSVLEIELQGYNVIRELMDMFWAAIVDREDRGNVKSPRRHPFSRFVYGRISENYRRVFENPSSSDADLPPRYRECLLLTDMVSGMTDSFAMDLCKELRALKGAYKIPDLGGAS